MIEQGLVKLIQSNSGVQAVLASGTPGISPGGYLDALPKDEPLPSWIYRVISIVPQYGLLGQPGLTFMRYQVDCFSYDRPGVVNLTKAIFSALSGYKGTLSDPDSTGVDSVFWSDEMDFDFDPNSRIFRRMIEFEINFYRS